MGVECLDCDGEEGMGEDCGVDVVPEEGVGLVGAYCGCEAGVDDVGEAEVRCVFDDCVEEIERVQVGDVDSWIEVLEEQQLAQGLVGGKGCRGVEGCEGMSLRHDGEIEDVGDEEVSGACSAEDLFIGCSAECDLEA